MLLYCGGDVRAFDTLYTRHEMGVWRFVYRSIQIQAVADDVMQDVWFAVARQAARYEPTARFKTWLFTLAHHRVVDYYRAQRPEVPWDMNPETDDAAAPFAPAAPSGFGPVGQLESRQQAQALLRAIEALPPVQREAFLLQAEGEMGVQEIAQATGVPVETAKSRLRYARSHLRDMLREFA